MGLVSIDPSTIDANILYLGLIIALWVGVTAAYVPGTGLLEVGAAVGMGICLIFLAEMPTNWMAVLVLVLGVGGFIVMPFLKQQYAALAVIGLALQATGSVGLFNGGTSVSLFLIAVTLVIQFAYHQLILTPMLKVAYREPVVNKDDLLVGSVGKVVKDIDPVGTVNVNSEMWTATSDRRIKAGEEIVVVERKGLQLTVESLKRKREQTAALEA